MLFRPPTPEHLETASGISTAHRYVHIAVCILVGQYKMHNSLPCSGIESCAGSSSKIPLGLTDHRKASTFLSKARQPWDFTSVVTDMLKFYAEQVHT